MAECKCGENCSCGKSKLPDGKDSCLGCSADTLMEKGSNFLDSQKAFIEQLKLEGKIPTTEEEISRFVLISEKILALSTEINEYLVSLCENFYEDEILFVICPYCLKEVDIGEGFGIFPCTNCGEEFEVLDEESFVYYTECPNCNANLCYYDGEEDENGNIECCTCKEKIQVD